MTCQTYWRCVPVSDTVDDDVSKLNEAKSPDVPVSHWRQSRTGIFLLEHSYWVTYKIKIL